MCSAPHQTVWLMGADAWPMSYSSPLLHPSKALPPPARTANASLASSTMQHPLRISAWDLSSTVLHGPLGLVKHSAAWSPGTCQGCAKPWGLKTHTLTTWTCMRALSMGKCDLHEASDEIVLPHMSIAIHIQHLQEPAGTCLTSCRTLGLQGAARSRGLWFFSSVHTPPLYCQSCRIFPISISSAAST